MEMESSTVWSSQTDPDRWIMERAKCDIVARNNKINKGESITMHDLTSGHLKVTNVQQNTNFNKTKNSIVCHCSCTRKKDIVLQ